MVVGLIMPASQQPERCEELFSLALALFKRLAEISLEFISLEELVREWCSLLLYTSPSREVRFFFLTCVLGSLFIECRSPRHP
jgi:hypothetical protein